MSSFLGEVHFEELPGKGRVRCVETGHELLAADKESYGRSKNCRRALFDLCLAQRKPPLNVFEQSATFRDKVICKLTGDLLNKSEDALWKHMNGKKFQRKLAQKEDDLQQRAEDAMDISRQVGDGDNARSDPDGETIDDSCNNEDRNMDLEELEIWVPPSDDQDSGCCGDVPSSNADQRCENEGGSDEVVQSMGLGSGRRWSTSISVPFLVNGNSTCLARVECIHFLFSFRCSMAYWAHLRTVVMEDFSMVLGRVVMQEKNQTQGKKRAQ